MTFEERVTALGPLGFSDVQTRFLVTVALHSGFCLRRHYMAFAGRKYGAGVRDFLDRLVTRKLARRMTFRADRGHVYHLHQSAIYAAIGQDDNRNRRHTSPALIARKLMLLDYVLGEPTGDWHATEADKVALFTTRFGVPAARLPQRVYLARRRSEANTTRYFIHKLPIRVAADPVIPSFVFLVTDTSGAAFEQFLHDHVRLLSAVPRWRIVAVAPRHIPGLPACELALRRFATTQRGPRSPGEIAELVKYFTTKQAVARDDTSWMNEGDFKANVGRWHEARQRFGAAKYEELFQRWQQEGPTALVGRDGEPFLAALREGRGTLVTYQLPISYDRFGSFAGLS